MTERGLKNINVFYSTFTNVFFVTFFTFLTFFYFLSGTFFYIYALIVVSRQSSSTADWRCPITSQQSAEAATINYDNCVRPSKHKRKKYITFHGLAHPMLQFSANLMPRAGSGVERIDLMSFLAVCRKSRLNKALSVLSLRLGFFLSVCTVLLTRATFFVFCYLCILSLCCSC